jgi:hypothetical protein
VQEHLLAPIDETRIFAQKYIIYLKCKIRVRQEESVRKGKESEEREREVTFTS